MKIHSYAFCFSLLVLTVSLISPSTSSSSSSSFSLLGVAPQDENYFKTETIKCKNGSKRFTRAQFNDGFCDCPDGTDEPGTSACPQGKFYCRNTGHLPALLYSSRVNDGICDCCDGSDEYDGGMKCPNTCREAGKLARDKLQKKIDMYKEGVVMRRQLVELAKQEMAKDKVEMSKLKNEEKVLKRLVKKLEARKEKIEKEEEREHVEKEKEKGKEEKMKEVAEDKDETGRQYAEEEKESSKTTNDEQIGALEEPSIDQTGEEENQISEELLKDVSKSTEGLPKEISESNEELPREELGRLVASRWTGEKGGHEVEESSTTRGNNGGDNESPNTILDKDDENVDKESSAGNNLDSSSVTFKSGLEEEKELSGRTTLSSSSWMETIQNTVRNLIQSVNLFSDEVDTLDADHVRKEYDDSSTKLSDIQEKISSLTEKLKQDLGVEKEFYFLYDQCIETKQDKYVYKVCPFKDAHQEEGYSKTHLGQWEKFENSYGVMLFSNGDRCWNGPDRSLKVKLRCGLKTELADVDEPSRCEYVALLTTPVRCLEEKLEELKHKLESMYKEQPHSHDEL